MCADNYCNGLNKASWNLTQTHALVVTKSAGRVAQLICKGIESFDVYVIPEALAWLYIKHSLPMCWICSDSAQS